VLPLFLLRISILMEISILNLELCRNEGSVPCFLFSIFMEMSLFLIVLDCKRRGRRREGKG